ncbi:MAG: exodeoxyribonuclease V subunit gamma, partial [Alteromonadales bacterium]|nr:exodeoxyribonuclease V subunit gamma [Alteromonadales bacterium]
SHGENLNSTLLGQGGGIFFAELPADFAYQRLAELIELYELGLQQPLPFFIQSAFAWCTFVNLQQPDCFILDDLDFETRAEAQQAALDIFASTRGFSEGSDPYISRVYDNIEDHWLTFESIAFKVFKPIISNLSMIEYSEEQA